MSQPQGFVNQSHPTHLCKLHKSLYGLKQAPRAWYERFSNFLLGLGFQTTYADPSLFIRHFLQFVTLMLLYVDDLIITESDSHYIHCLIAQLHHLFEMKDLGKLHHFLGVKVSYTSDGLFLSQTNTQRIYWLKHLCSTANQLGLPVLTKTTPPPASLLQCRIPLSIAAWLVPYNTSH